MSGFHVKNDARDIVSDIKTNFMMEKRWVELLTQNQSLETRF